MWVFPSASVVRKFRTTDASFNSLLENMLPRCSLNRFDGNIEQASHQLLGEPDGLILVADLQGIFSFLRGQDEKLRRGIAYPAKWETP